jgi:hypothetical protein
MITYCTVWSSWVDPYAFGLEMAGQSTAESIARTLMFNIVSGGYTSGPSWFTPRENLIGNVKGEF